MADVAAIPAWALAISFLSLGMSGVTAWLTLFRRGTVRMTQPEVIYFGPDGGERDDNEPLPPKIFMRTLLYATAKRGGIVESMYVRLRRRETIQNFNIWAYGDTGKLTRGSGLFVPETGYATNHHFLLPADGTAFTFSAGDYALDVYASLVGRRSPKLLWTIKVSVSTEEANALRDQDNGIYFDWGPETGKYHSHIRPKPKRPSNPFRELFSDALASEP